MAHKEADARIKINKLLEASGWRFFAEGNRPANIRLEPKVARGFNRSVISRRPGLSRQNQSWKAE